MELGGMLAGIQHAGPPTSSSIVPLGSPHIATEIGDCGFLQSA